MKGTGMTGPAAQARLGVAAALFFY
jgi:hypothetical protein